MEKAYKYRIYPNKMQKVLLAKTFGCCRFVYNHYLAKRIEMYEHNLPGKTKTLCLYKNLRSVQIERHKTDCLWNKYIKCL